MLISRNAALAAILLVTAACTAPVSEDELSDISKRTETVSTVLSSAADTQSTLLRETAEYEALCGYLSGRSPDLTPAKPTRKPSADAVALQGIGKALNAYAAALNDAVSGSSVGALETAATDFKSSTSALAADAGAPAATGPAIDALVNAYMAIGESRRNAQIRAIMEDVYPSLVLLERNLKEDAPGIVQETQSLIGDWERQASCVLRQVRKEPSVAIPYYEDIVADRAVIQRNSVALSNASKAVRALFEAHLLVFTTPPDAKVTFEVVKSILSDVDAVLNAS